MPHHALRATVIVALATAATLARVGPLPAQASSAPCTDPTPGDPEWWHYTWTLNSDGTGVGTLPPMPRVPADLPLEQWAGTYDLLVVATAGYHRGHDRSHGTLTLWVPEALRDEATCAGPGCWTPGPAVTLVGATDSAFHFPAGASLAHPTSQRPPRAPGVELEYHGETLLLIFGNSGLHWTDSGVFFDVFSIDSAGMRGRWVDGGITALAPGPNIVGGARQGYFCLFRRSGTSAER